MQSDVRFHTYGECIIYRVRVASQILIGFLIPSTTIYARAPDVQCVMCMFLYASDASSSLLFIDFKCSLCKCVYVVSLVVVYMYYIAYMLT